jgi:hypothetical protein
MGNVEISKDYSILDSWGLRGWATII